MMILNSSEKSKYRATKKFKTLRSKKIKEANSRCSLCGVKKSKGLHIHHIDESKYNESDEEKYTVVLCAECHKYIEYKVKVLSNPKNPRTEYSNKLAELLSNFSVEINV